MKYANPCICFLLYFKRQDDRLAICNAQYRMYCNMKTMTLEQIKTKYYGEVGTPERDRIENELAALHVGVQIREARERQSMTQSQLAERINKKREFISKVENDGGNITLKTLFEIVERGLGGKLSVQVHT